MVHRMTPYAAVAAFLTMGALSSPLVAQPDDSEAVPRVYPVDGRLQHDAVLVDDLVSMRFSASSSDWVEEWSDQPTRSCEDEDCRVTVADGRFSVPLGRHVALDDTVLERADFTITVEVYDDTSETWQSFGDGIDVHATAHSLWATTTGSITPDSFEVYGDLTLDAGTTSASGGLTIDDVFGSGSAGGALRADIVEVTSGTTEIGGTLNVVGEVSAGSLDLEGALYGSGAGRLFRHNGTRTYLGPDATSVTIENDVVATQVELVSDGSVIDLNGALIAENWGMQNGEYLFRSTFHDGFDPDDWGDRDGVVRTTDANDYYCWIGGFQMLGVDWCPNWFPTCSGGETDGDSCESDSDCDASGIGQCYEGSCFYYPMVQAYAFPDYSGDTWGASLGFSSTDIQSGEVQWMCANTSIVDFRCSDGDGNVSNDCTDEISSSTRSGASDAHGMAATGRWPSNWPAALADPEE